MTPTRPSRQAAAGLRSDIRRAAGAAALVLAALVPIACELTEGKIPDDYTRRYDEAVGQFNLRNFAAARDAFRGLLLDYPDQPFNQTVKLRVASCEYFLGNEAAARLAYREVLDALDDPALRAEALQGLGMLELQSGNYRAAAAQFEESERSSSDPFKKLLARYRTGVAYQQAGEFARARAILVEVSQSTTPQSIGGAPVERGDPSQMSTTADVVASARSRLELPDYFTVQAGAYGARANADELIEKLRAAGFAAQLAPPSDGPRSVHRVWVGRASDRRQAEALAARIVASKALDASVKPLVVP